VTIDSAANNVDVVSVVVFAAPVSDILEYDVGDIIGTVVRPMRYIPIER
jgi:hypothetical protein